MLRSSRMLVGSPTMVRRSPVFLCRSNNINVKYHSNATSGIISSFSSRSYATAPNPPTQKRSKWIWILPPAVVLGTALLMKDDQEKQDERFDTQKLYAAESTPELALSWFILKLCSYDFVVNYGPKLFEWAEKTYLSGIARWVMKKTFFKHFVAGETLEETQIATQHIKHEGLGVVLDYSIEAGSGTTEELDKIAQGILATVYAAAREPTPSFACLKVSGLTSFALLLRLSEIISHNNSKATPIQLAGEKSYPYLPRVLPPSPQTPPPPPLSHEEQLELAELVARLDIICRESAKNNVSLLIDAEQTYYQPAIDFLALHFSHKYNKKTPIVYNTYQMYLKDGPARLITDIDNAKKQGFYLGVKLVRGAYLHSERKRAQELGYTDPVAQNIEETHANYYKALEMSFANVSKVGLMIASHNEDTVLKSMERLKELNLDTKNSKIQFAQLYGMGDHLSFLLVQNGLSVYKYVPFGPVEQVLPYLIRRMQENRGFIGSASSTERKLLWKELRRRLWFETKPSAAAGVVASSRGTL